MFLCSSQVLHIGVMFTAYYSLLFDVVIQLSILHMFLCKKITTCFCTMRPIFFHCIYLIRTVILSSWLDNLITLISSFSSSHSMESILKEDSGETAHFPRQRDGSCMFLHGLTSVLSIIPAKLYWST